MGKRKTIDNGFVENSNAITVEPNVGGKNEAEEKIGPVVLNFRDSKGIYYIHGYIDDTLSKNIIAPLINDIETLRNMRNAQPIKMFITSGGGSLHIAFDLINIFEYAARNNVQIHTIVTSYAASAASLIAVSGHKRYVGKRAYHLLHFASWDMFARNSLMAQRNTDTFTWMQDEIVKIYQSCSKLDDKKLKQELLADNYMINGSKALIKAGLADEEF